jgi:hypothetical protein
MQASRRARRPVRCAPKAIRPGGTADCHDTTRWPIRWSASPFQGGLSLMRSTRRCARGLACAWLVSVVPPGQIEIAQIDLRRLDEFDNAQTPGQNEDLRCEEFSPAPLFFRATRMRLARWKKLPTKSRQGLGSEVSNWVCGQPCRETRLRAQRTVRNRDG